MLQRVACFGFFFTAVHLGYLFLFRQDVKPPGLGKGELLLMYTVLMLIYSNSYNLYELIFMASGKYVDGEHVSKISTYLETFNRKQTYIYILS